MRRLLCAFTLLTLFLRLSIGAEIHVFAAASLSDVLKEIAVSYQQQSSDKVVFNFAGSNFLARQIDAGAPADIFFSADESQMDRVEKNNLVAKSTRRNRLSNSLVIVVAADSAVQIDSAHDLTKSDIKRIAIADPRGVPAGIYAKAFLEKQKLWPSLSAKIVPTENVRAALAAVEAGNVEAAIVYQTDAAISKKAKIAFKIPSADTPPIHYPVAIVKDAKQPAAAAKFIDYLFSPAATALFEKRGFITE